MSREPKVFREKPEVQIFAKLSAPLTCCTRSAFSGCLKLKAKRLRVCYRTGGQAVSKRLDASALEGAFYAVSKPRCSSPFERAWHLVPCPIYSKRLAQNANRARLGPCKIIHIKGRLGQSDVRRRFAAIAACFDVEGHFLVVGQTGQTGALNSGNVNENVLAAAFGRDEAVAFGGVEPFDGT